MDLPSSGSYAIWPGLKGVLAQVGINATDVLRRAGLPEDLLNRHDARLSAEEYMRINEAIDASVGDAEFWVRFIDAIHPEWFSPPVFAALCSPDLAVAAERMALFKPLIGPLVIAVHNGREGLELTYRWLPTTIQPPGHLHLLEAMFAVKLARLGTHGRVCPTRVVVPALPAKPAAYEEFLGIGITLGDETRVAFSPSDARRPFMSSNSAMWNMFEPELRKRLADLEGDATFAQRTQAVLMEALPSGQLAMDAVARRLAVSPRTFQRRLNDEGTSFKQVIGTTRERLARYYLHRTKLSSTEIAYLLGFEEPKSFFRAFQRWTGKTPEELRRQMRGASADGHA